MVCIHTLFQNTKGIAHCLTVVAGSWSLNMSDVRQYCLWLGAVQIKGGNGVQQCNDMYRDVGQGSGAQT